MHTANSHTTVIVYAQPRTYYLGEMAGTRGAIEVRLAGRQLIKNDSGVSIGNT